MKDKMKLKQPGKNISRVEITHISKNCIWVLLDDKEYMLPYSAFPWFRDATVSQIHNVKLGHGSHLRWPDLDVDLEAGRMEEPGKYPLLVK